MESRQPRGRFLRNEGGMEEMLGSNERGCPPLSNGGAGAYMHGQKLRLWWRRSRRWEERVERI